LVLIFAGLLGQITGLWPSLWPQKLEDAISYSIVIIPAAIYYLTPLRDWANRKFFQDISENIRSKIVQISTLQDEPTVYTWKAIRGIFFHFIDIDKSLTVKASLAYFNGFIWTTLADIRALAFTFTVIAVALWILLGVAKALIAAVLFLAGAVLSYWGSVVVSRRHKEIGDEQIEIIEHNYQLDLKKMMEAVRDRARASGDQSNQGGA